MKTKAKTTKRILVRVVENDISRAIDMVEQLVLARTAFDHDLLEARAKFDREALETIAMLVTAAAHHAVANKEPK